SSVTIGGSQFGGGQAGSTVTFNGLPANVLGWSDSSILVSVPYGATTGPVVVTVNGRASNAPTFTVLVAADLVVQSIATNPVAPTPGQPVTATVTVLNQGGVSAGAFWVDFYMHSAGAPS